MRWIDCIRRVFSSVLIALLITSFTKYELPCRKDILEESENFACSQIGIIEQGENRGEVAKYLKAVGLNEGYPYCAAGVYWCFYKAVKSMKVSTHFIPVKRTAGANDMLNDAIKNGSKKEGNAERHDLLVWRSKNSWRGHIERVIVTKDKDIVKTIGFNVKTESGEGVAVKTRFLRHPLGRMMLRGIITFKEV